MLEFFALASAKLAKFIFSPFGNGSAFPGRVALAIDSKFLTNKLSKMPLGVVMVSGSNGKSTTSAFLTRALRSQGLKVFTNASGANLPQGIASAIAENYRLVGKNDYQIAVLEVDEAFAQQISKQVKPDWVVLTNLQVDQLNRFSEPERVYQMLSGLAAEARNGVVLNGSDTNLLKIGAESKLANVSYVDLSPEVRKNWPVELFQAPGDLVSPLASQRALGILEAVSEGLVTVSLQGIKQELKVGFYGVHNAIALTLAAASVISILRSKTDIPKLVRSLETAETVYGRSDLVDVSGSSLRILMMKNKPSMQALLFAEKQIHEAWISVDEGTPDPSWLFDIDLSKLESVKIISGSRCWHVALWLYYAGYRDFQVIPETKLAMNEYLSYLTSSNASGTLIANYEQTLLIRKLIGLKSIASR